MVSNSCFKPWDNPRFVRTYKARFFTTYDSWNVWQVRSVFQILDYMSAVQKFHCQAFFYILCWKIRYLRGSTNPYATEAPLFPLLLLPRNIAHVGNPGLHLGIELAQIAKNCGSEACEILLDSQFSQVFSRFFPRRLVEGETSLSILCCGDLCGQVDLLHSKLLELRWGHPAIPSDCVKASRICPG